MTLARRELEIMLEAQAFIEADEGARWETHMLPRNFRAFALCNHGPQRRWRNQCGRLICGVCHPPVTVATTDETAA